MSLLKYSYREGVKWQICSKYDKDDNLIFSIVGVRRYYKFQKEGNLKFFNAKYEKYEIHVLRRD